MRLLRRVHRTRMRLFEPPFPFLFLTDDLSTLGCVPMAMADRGLTMADRGLTDWGLTDWGVTDWGVTDWGVTDWGLPIVSARFSNMAMIASDFLLYSGGLFFEFVHTK